MLRKEKEMHVGFYKIISNKKKEHKENTTKKTN